MISRKQTALALWYLLVSVPFVIAFFGIKWIPQLIITGGFGLVVVLLGLVPLDKLGRFLLAPVIGLVFLASSIVCCIQTMLWIAPAVTAGGHPVMPLGQVALGLAFGVLLGILMTWFHFKRARPAPRLQAVWISLLFLALAISLAVDRLA
ncbi:MAG: hypothetical protein JRJ19_08485 [Deltaproteobacteria bacterium]|nr:hypothetical protein [Deltaproteobacteria bacterium]